MWMRAPHKCFGGGPWKNWRITERRFKICIFPVREPIRGAKCAGAGPQRGTCDPIGSGLMLCTVAGHIRNGHVFDSAIATIGCHGQSAGPLFVNDVSPSFGTRKLQFVHAASVCRQPAQQKKAVGCQSSLQMPPPIIGSNATTSDISQSTVPFQIDAELLTTGEAASAG